MTVNKLSHAQFFTPPDIAQLMLDLLRNPGRTLEPSCGDGAFSKRLENAVAIELDETVAPEYAKVMDFFEYPISEKFSTVIGNPPYLSHKSIPESTRNLSMFKQLETRLGGLANLYAYFILKSFLHLEPNGELVFVVPEECFRTTSNFKLFDYLHKHGTFTDIIRFKKTPFKEVSQDVLIFRYEKDNLSYLTDDVRIDDGL